MGGRVKKGVMLSLMFLGLAGQGLALDCSVETVQKTINFFHQPNNQTQPNIPYKVISSRPIKLLPNLTLCEAILGMVVEEEQGGGKEVPRFLGPKTVAYVGSNIMIVGDVRVKEGDRVRMVSYERFHEVNKEFFEEMRRKQEEWEREMIKRQEQEERGKQESLMERVKRVDLSKVGDMEFGGGGIEFLVFGDVMCPYCKRVAEFLDEEMKKGKRFKVRYVLVGILSDTSVERAVGVLCKYKSSEERLRALRNKEEVGKGGCDEGRERVKMNNEVFRRLGVNGVPLVVVYEGGEVVDVVMGADLMKLRGYIDRGNERGVKN